MLVVLGLILMNTTQFLEISPNIGATNLINHIISLDNKTKKSAITNLSNAFSIYPQDL